MLGLLLKLVTTRNIPGKREESKTLIMKTKTHMYREVQTYCTHLFGVLQF